MEFQKPYTAQRIGDFSRIRKHGVELQYYSKKQFSIKLFSDYRIVGYSDLKSARFDCDYLRVEGVDKVVNFCVKDECTPASDVYGYVSLGASDYIALTRGKIYKFMLPSSLVLLLVCFLGFGLWNHQSVLEQDSTQGFFVQLDPSLESETVVATENEDLSIDRKTGSAVLPDKKSQGTISIEDLSESESTVVYPESKNVNSPETVAPGSSSVEGEVSDSGGSGTYQAPIVAMEDYTAHPKVTGVTVEDENGSEMPVESDFGFGDYVLFPTGYYTVITREKPDILITNPNKSSYSLDTKITFPNNEIIIKDIQPGTTKTWDAYAATQVGDTTVSITFTAKEGGKSVQEMTTTWIVHKEK